jgi:hypothetical protein
MKTECCGRRKEEFYLGRRKNFALLVGSRLSPLILLIRAV